MASAPLIWDARFFFSDRDHVWKFIVCSVLRRLRQLSGEGPVTDGLVRFVEDRADNADLREVKWYWSVLEALHNTITSHFVCTLSIVISCVHGLLSVQSNICV